MLPDTLRLFSLKDNVPIATAVQTPALLSLTWEDREEGSEIK